MIKLQKIDSVYFVLADNGKDIGKFEMDVDGSYYFWQEPEVTGCWTAHTLKEIADKLDEVNEPYSKQVEQYFREEKFKSNDSKNNK